MASLRTDHAGDIIHQLEKEQANGKQYVMVEYRPAEEQLATHHLDFFSTLDDVLDLIDEKEGYETLPHLDDNRLLYYQTIGDFGAAIWAANQLNPSIHLKETNTNSLNNKTMNLNNLQDLKKEVVGLGFSPKVADELEKNMRALPLHFTIKDQLPGDKGQVDLNLHFHKSSVSDAYSFSKYDATAGRVPPSAPNQSYMVLTENKDNKEKPLVKAFNSPNEAIEFFKKQKGNSELGLGESPESKQILASMEKGKVNFVHDDFRGAYYSPAIKQTFYVKEGNGYTASQAANMVQGRTVHRDDLLNPRNGEPYQAWVKLDTEQKKDDWGNFKLKQMNDPAFGFDLDKTLKGFKIKELSDPGQKEAIVAGIKNGDRVPVTVTNREGKEIKVMAEASPQYKTFDFYTQNGAREKREQFKKPEVAQSQSRGQGKEKEQKEEHSMSVR